MKFVDKKTKLNTWINFAANDNQSMNFSISAGFVF